MRHSKAYRRLVTVATLTALIGGIIGVSAPVLARDAGSAESGFRILSDPAREAAGVRSNRRVNVSDLPTATGTRPSYVPAVRQPDGALSPAPSDTQGGGPPPPIETVANGDPALVPATAFAGLANDADNVEPPDPWVAAGPEHVFQAVNTTFRISNRSGTAITTVDMFEFFGLGEFYSPGEVRYFDPRVIYDSLHARWVAIQASFDCFVNAPSATGTGYLDIAVSDGSDPTAGWIIRSIPFSDALPDYPGLGTSTDKVVVSSNLFGLLTDGSPIGCGPAGAFLGTEMEVLAWSELMGAGAAFLDSFGTPSPLYSSWRPALQTPATSATVFAIAKLSTNQVAYARITGSPAGGGVTTIVYDDLASLFSPFALPPAPNQPGPDTIESAVDHRPTDAVWKANRLAFVSTYPCDPAGGVSEDRDCVRVSELSTATPASPTRIQDFLIAEEATDLYMGGIGYALNDDLHVVWTRSSETAGNYASSWGAYQTSAAAVNTISDRAVLSPGTDNYPGTRWGDYVGVAQDPQVPNAVWQANQYAVTNGWATDVTQLQTGGSSFVPITPLRVVDSRTPTGVAGIFNANVPQTFLVAGVGTIPADAVAVTGNVTVTGQTAAGFVAITPSPTSTPQSSTLNFPLADNRANNFTIPLAANGRLAAVYKAVAGKKAHVIVDITGYFLAGEGEATYKTLTPVRILDTRPPPERVGPLNKFQAGVPQTLSVAGANGVPTDAVAITGNLTVTGQTKAGYLSVTPNPPVGIPPSSSLNFPLGDTRANGLTARLNGSGDLSITYTANGAASAHVILDVTGFYVPDNSGLLFYPLTPGRILDSRLGAVLSGLSGQFTASNPRRLDTDGHWGVPDNAEAVSGNLTVVNQTAAGFLAITPASDATPDTSTLNFPLGDIRANGVTVPLNAAGNMFIVYKAVATNKTDVILDVSGYFK